MQGTLDRSAVIDKAAKSVSRGDLGGALKLYLQIFDNDPHDWSVGNTVGDLYVKMGRPSEAAAHFAMLAEQVAADGFAAKARALYRKIVRLQPGNEEAKRRVEELDRQTAGQTSPFLKRVLETARALRESPAVVAADPVPPVIETPPEPAPAPIRVDDIGERFRQIDAAAALACARADHRAAVAIVESFLAGHPDHVLALERLVDISVEGQFDADLIDAQHRLANACVTAGHYRQAFDVALDLRARHPGGTRHHELLGRIVEIAHARGRNFVVPPLAEPEPEVVEEVARPRLVPPPVPAAPVVVAPPAPVPAPVVPAAAPTVPGGSIAIGPPYGDLLKEWSDPDRPREDIRDALLESAAATAEEKFTQALRLVETRHFGDAERLLEEAMCLPHLRVPAGAQLARVCRDTGSPLEAMAVLEWVLEVPPADEDSGHELAYELAITLESLGQEAQALGVYRELLAEVGPAYRDIATRVERLAAA